MIFFVKIFVIMARNGKWQTKQIVKISLVNVNKCMNTFSTLMDVWIEDITLYTVYIYPRYENDTKNHEIYCENYSTVFFFPFIRIDINPFNLYGSVYVLCEPPSAFKTKILR